MGKRIVSEWGKTVQTAGVYPVYLTSSHHGYQPRNTYTASSLSSFQ